MGQRFAKKSSVSEQATPCKELISNDLGSHVEVKSALDVGTTVKHTDSSQDVHEEEMEEVDAPHLATLHGGMEPNTESEEQIETTSTALSNVGLCIEKPTASGGSRESPSPQAEPPPMPLHITPQVSKHPPTHPSVSVGGSTSGSGSGQQLVIPIKPQADGSDRHQQQSDGAPSPTSPSSPGKDGSNTHTPDGLGNRATAEEEETTGGSHLKYKAPAPDHDSRVRRTEEPIDSAWDERDLAGGSGLHCMPQLCMCIVQCLQQPSGLASIISSFVPLSCMALCVQVLSPCLLMAVLLMQSHWRVQPKTQDFRGWGWGRGKTPTSSSSSRARQAARGSGLALLREVPVSV